MTHCCRVQDCHSYEAFLNMYFTTRSFKEVKVIAAEMQANRVAFTPRALMAIINLPPPTHLLANLPAPCCRRAPTARQPRPLPHVRLPARLPPKCQARTNVRHCPKCQAMPQTSGNATTVRQ